MRIKRFKQFEDLGFDIVTNHDFDIKGYIIELEAPRYGKLYYSYDVGEVSLGDPAGFHGMPAQAKRFTEEEVTDLLDRKGQKLEDRFKIGVTDPKIRAIKASDILTSVFEVTYANRWHDTEIRIGIVDKKDLKDELSVKKSEPGETRNFATFKEAVQSAKGFLNKMGIKIQKDLDKLNNLKEFEVKYGRWFNPSND